MIAEVQAGDSGTGPTASGTPFNLPANVTAGNAVIVWISTSDPAQAASAMSGGGITNWARVGAHINVAATEGLELWFGSGSSGGSKAITITAGSSFWAQATEFSGINIASAISLAQTGSATFSGTTQGQAIFAAPNQLVVAAMVASHAFTAFSGLTTDYNGSATGPSWRWTSGLDSAYQVNGGSGATYTPTWTSTNGTTFGVIAATFTATSSGSPSSWVSNLIYDLYGLTTRTSDPGNPWGAQELTFPALASGFNWSDGARPGNWNIIPPTNPAVQPWGQCLGISGTLTGINIQVFEMEAWALVSNVWTKFFTATAGVGIGGGSYTEDTFSSTGSPYTMNPLTGGIAQWSFVNGYFNHWFPSNWPPTAFPAGGTKVHLRQRVGYSGGDGTTKILIGCAGDWYTGSTGVTDITEPRHRVLTPTSQWYTATSMTAAELLVNPPPPPFGFGATGGSLMPIGIDWGFSVGADTPFFTGTSGATSLVPYPYDVAIGGRTYLVDFEFTPFRREAYRHKSIEITRTQADTNGVPGEHTLNPAGLWRRSQESWGHGAGQVYLDRTTSDSTRFRYSKGLDVWTPYQFQLLNATALVYTSAGTNIRMAVTGTYLWVIDATNMGYTTAPLATFTPTMTAVGTTYDLTSDGYNAWAVTSSGIWKGNDGTPTPAQYFAHSFGATSVIGYALGRLMVGDGPALYNVTAASLPAALMTHPNAGWNWVGFAEGTGFIYAAGTAGAHSAVYQVTIQPDGTTLTAPSVSCTLPRGETISSIKGYLGFILIGTNRGVRVATANTAGNLTLGALVTPSPAMATNMAPTQPGPVQCFEAQDRFAWYGYTNFDASSTGLGRLDLSTLGALPNAPGTPAWSSDLMYSGQGTVTSVASWYNTTQTVWCRLFAVAGVGIVAENAAVPVATGTLQTGLITYDMSDLKYAVFIDILPGANPGTVAAYLSNDQLPFQLCGTATVHNNSLVEFPTPQTVCNTMELQFVLTSTNSTPNGGSAQVHRTTVRSMVAARSSTQFIIPLRLSSVEVGRVDQAMFFDPDFERAFLDDLRVNRTITTFQENNSTYAVTVDALDWTPDRMLSPGADRMAGVLVTTLTTIT